ncbi:50S ribosomal protein L23 [Candidatus Peregrinibacteria bacterium]|nr:50S ribosomal protein L23 [Candidatus Peregrinibacteria bacterium]
MKTFSPIIRSYITEKSSNEQSRGRYSFLVDKNATKIDIKNAVHASYGVDADTVRTMVIPRKFRTLKGKHQWAKRPSFKKAVVTLKGKTTIDPNKIKESKPKK